MAVRNQPSHEIDGEVRRTPVPRVFDVHEMLELVKDGFHQGAATQDDFLVQQQQAVRHIPFEVRHQAHATRLEQLARERLRQIAFITT